MTTDHIVMGSTCWSHSMGPEWTCGLSLKFGLHYTFGYLSNGSGERFLLSNVGEWCKEHLGEWVVGLTSLALQNNVEQNEFVIFFKSPSDLVMFKLMWPDANSAPPVL